MSYDDPLPSHLRQAMEEAARFQKLVEGSGLSRVMEQAAATQRLYEQAVAASSIGRLIDVAGVGALNRLAVESGYGKILEQNAAPKATTGTDFSAALDLAGGQ